VEHATRCKTSPVEPTTKHITIEPSGQGALNGLNVRYWIEHHGQLLD
jgi:hypothetical protein